MPKKKTENKYLTNEALRHTVAEAIARLELDLHQINLAVLMHGKDVKIGEEGETESEAIERVNAKIEAIETEYADVLKEE